MSNLSFAEKLKMFSGGAKVNNNNQPKQAPGKIKMPTAFPTVNQGGSAKEADTKIIKGSTIISEENPNLKIYAYPNKGFSPTEKNNSKIIVFLGNAQESFINTFINIYRDISFEEKERYKIDFKNKNENTIMTYDIKPYDKKKKNSNISIISIPFAKEKDENYIKALISIFTTAKARINLICYTFEETTDLDLNQLSEIEFFKYFLNYLEVRDKLLFLCSSGKEQDNNQVMNLFKNKFDIDRNDYICELFKDKIYKDEILYMDNKFIYEKDADSEKGWKLLSEKMGEIQKKINSSKAKTIPKEKMELFKSLFEKGEDIRKKFIKYKPYKTTEEYIKNFKDLFFLIYFWLNLNVKDNKIETILDFYNVLMKVIHSNKQISLNDSEINFDKDVNFNKAIKVLSKLHFSNLSSLIGTNCLLIDQDLNLLINIIADNLININLSNNKLQNINVLLESEALNNLEDLDLSHNEIEDISRLSDTKLFNLKRLNLSHNKINNINFLESDPHLDKLEILDLSDNQINKLFKINLKNIKNLNLSNNKINEGVNEFIGSISNLCKKLTLEKLSDSILFDYSDTLMAKFHYWIKDDEIDILEKFPFDGIIDLLIKGFEDTGLKFLSNESLKDLEDLDLKDNNIKTLNMFNKISFTGIKKIKLVNTYSLDNIKAFPSSEIKSITIENNGVHFTFINPELELSINNFNILLDDLIEKSELNDKIKINGIPKDNELFSYNNFRDKKLKN